MRTISIVSMIFLVSVMMGVRRYSWSRCHYYLIISTSAHQNSSTNALIHLIAIAGRVGIKLTLEDFDTFGRDIPTIVNLMPSGEYLMEEFYYAGGLPVVLRSLIEKGYLHGDLMTVTGLSHWENVADIENFDEKVIMPLETPLAKPPHICVLTKGNLAQNGAVIKVSAASKHLLQHTGRACVFKDIDDYKARIDDEELDCDENSVLVLQNCGLRGKLLLMHDTNGKLDCV